MTEAKGLAMLAPLLGSWTTEMIFPDQTLKGVAQFEWLEEVGGLLVLRSHTAEADLPPRAIAVIAFDDSTGQWSMVYHDARGVSRIYSMTFDGRNWTLQGKPEGFHQRFRAVVKRDTIDAIWEQSDDGATWSTDFRIFYRRDILART